MQHRVYYITCLEKIRRQQGERTVNKDIHESVAEVIWRKERTEAQSPGRNIHMIGEVAKNISHSGRKASSEQGQQGMGKLKEMAAKSSGLWRRKGKKFFERINGKQGKFVSQYQDLRYVCSSGEL